MNIVFDTNALISATLWYESSAQKVLNKILKEGHSIYSSADIITEYRNVLRRDFNFPEEKINLFLGKILSFVNIIMPLEKIKFIEDYPDDNKILECVISSSSDYIITYDNHLLNIKEFRGIKIIKPEDLTGI